MNNKTINIPQEHIEKIKFYFNLSEEYKNNIVNTINSISLGISPNIILEKLIANIPSLSHDELEDILQIYFSLSGTRDHLNLSQNDFSIILKNTFEKFYDKDLESIDELINSLNKLLENNVAANNAKLLSSYAENDKNYIDSKLTQDIRPVFNHTNELIASIIINNLKITYNDNNEEKDIYITLDRKDIEDLINKLELSLSKINSLTNNFENLKIVEIK